MSDSRSHPPPQAHTQVTAAPHHTLADFDFDLPPELIAQHPAAERTAARLLDGRQVHPVDRIVRGRNEDSLVAPRRPASIEFTAISLPPQTFPRSNAPTLIPDDVHVMYHDARIMAHAKAQRRKERERTGQFSAAEQHQPSHGPWANGDQDMRPPVSMRMEPVLCARSTAYFVKGFEPGDLLCVFAPLRATSDRTEPKPDSPRAHSLRPCVRGEGCRRRDEGDTLRWLAHPVLCDRFR